MLDPAAILASIGEVPYAWQVDTDTLAWGQNLGAVLAIADPAEVATGRRFACLVDTETKVTRFDAVTQAAAKDVGQGVPYQIQYRLRPSPETELWIEDTGRAYAAPDRRPVRAHGVMRVINERHKQEEELAYLSRFDALTGEMNREHLTEILGATLDEAIKLRGSCGFLLIAIDDLTRINEAFGYTIADEVISAVAKRLRAKMRGGDLLGRFSGNKFGVILKTCTPDEMEVAAERFLTGVRDDVIQTAAGPVAVTVTIGGVAAPRHARDVTDILARSQESLYAAKARRRGSFQPYRPSVEREALRRENVRSTDRIVTALNERRIVLAYEPVVAVATRKPAFHECLMRLRQVDGTLVNAGEVIPVAERLGLVRLIDHRVLELLITDMVEAPDLKASINVSPASTTDPDWWASLGAQLRRHPNVAERLVVEITEMAAIHDIDETRGFVTRVKDVGCRIAIDDFGAGYTSFRNLRKLGVDIIKIDGAFVRNITSSEDDRIFVRTLLELGRSLGLATVAEWVQDEEAASLLASWGCDYLQGALIGLATVGRPETDGGTAPLNAANG